MEKETMGKCNEQKTVANTVDIYPVISIITSNVNVLNAPVEEMRLYVIEYRIYIFAYKNPTLNIKTQR